MNILRNSSNVSFLVLGFLLYYFGSGCNNLPKSDNQDLLSDSILAIQYEEAGDKWVEEYEYDSALTSFQKANTLFERDNNWKKYCESCSKMAGSLFSLGQYDSTIIIIMKNWEDCLKINNRNIPLGFYQNLSNAYNYKDELDSAYKYALLAVESVEKDTIYTNHQIFISYNVISNYHIKRGEYNLSSSYLKKVLNRLLSSPNESQVDIAMCHYNLAVCSMFLGKCDSSLYNLEESINIREKIFPQFHRDLGYSYHGLGEIYFHCNGDYEKAAEFYEKALYQWENSLKDNNSILYNAYVGVANIYFAKADYEKAIVLYQKALTGLIGPIGQAGAKTQIGVCYASMNNFKTAIPYFKNVVNSLLPLVDQSHPYLLANYTNLGIAYSNNKQYDSAQTYLLKASKLVQLDASSRKRQNSEINDGLGWVKRYQKKFDEAMQYFQVSSALQIELFGFKYSRLAGTYHNMGLLNKEFGYYDSALVYYQKGLTTLGENSSDTSSLADISSYRRYYEILGSMAATLHKKYELDQDISNLETAYKTYQRAVDIVDSMRISYQESGSKLNIAAKAFPIYEGAIQCAQQLSTLKEDQTYLSSAFNFAERSKSILLMEAIQNTEAIQFAGIPDSLIEKERQLKIDVAFYENKLLTEKDSAKKQLYQNYLIDYKTAYYTLKQGLEAEYPTYHALKYDVQTLTVEQLQTQILDKDEAVIEYFLGDSMLFTFVVTQDNIQMIEQKRQPAWLENWRLLKSTFDSNRLENEYTQTWTDYVQAAHELYGVLIAPISKEIQDRHRLIIVPDGFLGYIPFELLLEEIPRNNISQKEYSSLAYLLEKYQIQYAYSSTLWQDNLKSSIQKRHNGEYLALAPFSSSQETDVYTQVRLGFEPLQNSEAEVTNIGEYFRGDALIGEKIATKNSFLNRAGNYGLLHISTHGEVNDEYVMLLFKDGNQPDTLFMNEIYNLKLQAEMVVLSACRTGIGQEQKGEGIMSLGRAFTYAGVPSILMSLWQVNDETTSQLMGFFYETLAEGVSKDDALRIAKLKYLEKASPTHQAPYYWAGFILSGNAEPINLKRKASFLWW